MDTNHFQILVQWVRRGLQDAAALTMLVAVGPWAILFQVFLPPHTSETGEIAPGSCPSDRATRIHLSYAATTPANR